MTLRASSAGLRSGVIMLRPSGADWSECMLVSDDSLSINRTDEAAAKATSAICCDVQRDYAVAWSTTEGHCRAR